MRARLLLIVGAAGAAAAGAGADFQKIYWINNNDDRIARANLDGSAVEDVTPAPFGVGWGVAPAPGALLFTDGAGGLVVRAGLDGSEPEIVLCHGLSSPEAIAVDAAASMLYVADPGLGAILRAGFDGSGLETVVEGVAPGGVAVDAVNGKLYWTEGGTVRRADLDGGNVETLLEPGLAALGAIAVDPAGGKFYFIRTVGPAAVRRANLDGTSPETIVAQDVSGGGGLAVDAAGAKIYWTSGDALYRADLDGTGPQLFAVSGTATGGIGVDASGTWIYWTDDERFVKRAEIAAPVPQTLIGAEDLHALDMAVDAIHRKLYWTTIETIRRSNLDGSAPETIVEGLVFPRGIALDAAGGSIYWVESQPELIRRADLDGANVEDLVTAGLTAPFRIDLDLAAGKMYWLDIAVTDRLMRADLDGTGVEVLLLLQTSGGGLALNAAAGKVYWTDSFEDEIRRADLDGTGAEVVLDGLAGPGDLFIDAAAGLMYFSDAGDIRRAGLDGAALETLIETAACCVALGPVEAGFADVDGDGTVGILDLLIVIEQWGPCDCNADCPADLDGDQLVGITDFLLVLFNWTL